MNNRPRDFWFDEDAGPLVRSYAVTRGRTNQPRHNLDVITLIMVSDTRSPLQRVEPEYADLLQLCRVPVSVAEVSARLNLPLAVTKILIDDLIDDGHLIFRTPIPSDGTQTRDINVLRTVLNGIRNL